MHASASCSVMYPTVLQGCILLLPCISLIGIMPFNDAYPDVSSAPCPPAEMPAPSCSLHATTRTETVCPVLAKAIWSGYSSSSQEVSNPGLKQYYDSCLHRDGDLPIESLHAASLIRGGVRP